MIERRNKTLNEDEINLQELIKSIFQYKWSILFISLVALLLAIRFLYFKTPIYSSHALIEVKSDTKKGIQEGDLIGSAFSSFGGEKVDKEIEILKTFHINNLALSKVSFHTRYYIDKPFKKIEVYENVPIEVKDVTIFDSTIVGYFIQLIPDKLGYHLHIVNSFQTKILHLLFGKKMVTINDEILYPYNKPIKNKYFELTVNKKSNIIEPINFVLKTNNRKIYESIRGRLKITQINPSAPLIQIAFEDNIRSRANAYVNAVAESFILQSVAEKSKRNDRIIEFIEQQLSEIKKKLDDSEEKLERYRITHQAINPSLQASTYIQELSKIEIELSQNELKKILIQNLLKFISNNEDLDAIAPFLIELNDSPTLELIAKLQEAQIREEGLKAQYSAKHPGFLAVRKQIKYIKKKIILNVKNLKSSMFHRNTNLKKLKETYEDNLKSIPTKERTLVNLKRDYEVSSGTYNYLLKKKSENEMIKVTILSDYRIIDRAYNDGHPIGLKPMLTLIIALILGFIVGILQALIRTFLDDTIKNKEDIENHTDLPIYGLIPKLKQKVIKLDVYKDPKSPFAESYRSLRTNLQFTRKDQQANVVLVTSTIMGEGKTTTAANLGAILQMANYKTIVINLDMRKPTLHHYFDIDNSVGMSTYLSGKNIIQDIIHTTKHKYLDVITSGPIPPNPSELILTKKLDTLLEHLKENYDYIILDSAPLGLVTDTMHLTQYSDINLVVVRESYSKKSFISDIDKLVKEHELKHIGIILNSVDIASGLYGYGYGYGYGEE